MSVVSFYVQDFLVKNTRKDTLVNCNIPENILNLIKESIIFNNLCHIEMDDNAFYVPVGNGTEVSLLKWLQGAEIPVHLIIKTKESALKAQFVFSSKDKMSLVAIKHDEIVRVYVKGAPEVVLPHCHHKWLFTGEHAQYENEGEVGKQIVLDQFVGKDFTKDQGLKCLAFSYADFSHEDFESIAAETNNFAETESFMRLLTEKEHTFLTIINLKDPLRDNVKEAVKLAQVDGKVSIRLVSSDHLETAKFMAVDAGICAKSVLEN